MGRGFESKINVNSLVPFSWNGWIWPCAIRMFGEDETTLEYDLCAIGFGYVPFGINISLALFLNFCFVVCTHPLFPVLWLDMNPSFSIYKSLRIFLLSNQKLKYEATGALF